MLLLAAAATLSVATLPRHRIEVSSCSLRCTHYWGEHNYNYTGEYNLVQDNTVIDLIYTRWLDPVTLTEVPNVVLNVTNEDTSIIRQNVTVSISRETGAIISINDCSCISLECNVTFCSSPPRYFKIDFSEQHIFSSFDICTFLWQGRSDLVDDESDIVALCGDDDVGRFNTTIPSSVISVNNASIPPELHASTESSTSSVSTVLLTTIAVSAVAFVIGGLIFWVRHRGDANHEDDDGIDSQQYLADTDHPLGMYRSQYLAPHSVAIYDNELENNADNQNLYAAIEEENTTNVPDAPIPPPRPSMYATAFRVNHEDKENDDPLYDIPIPGLSPSFKNHEEGVIYDPATMSMPDFHSDPETMSMSDFHSDLMVTNPTYATSSK